MGRTRSIRTFAETVATVLAVAALSTSSNAASAQPPEDVVLPGEVPPAPEEAPPRDRFALRLGFLHGGLFDSGQGRPFFYLDFGLRYKTDEYYVDVKLPAFVAGLDWLSFQIQSLIGVNSPFNLFEFANEPIQYAAYLEPAHVRLGQTFSFRSRGGTPFRLTGGVFALVDFVFFELSLVGQDPEDFEDIEDPSATDPFIVAPGGFVSVGGDVPLSEWDLALGIGPDVYQNPAYAPAGGLVIYSDFEVQIDPLDDIGAYLRTRFSTYTHTQPLVWTMIVTYGVALKLL